MVAAGLLGRIYLEKPTCSIQASEYCLSPTECNANTTVWWQVALILEVKVNRMWKYLQSSDHYYENLLIFFFNFYFKLLDFMVRCGKHLLECL